MRELHVVAVSEDGRSVVLATSRGATRGGFRVAIDERLVSAVRGDLAPADHAPAGDAPSGEAPRDELPRGEAPPVGVSPKEIQARLRAGESVEEIAANAGVPVSKVERFAGPVLSERERVLDQARSGYVSRSRLGASALPLGEAVDRHLAGTTGVRPETVAWSVRREEVGTWVVQVSYVSQARRRTASWRYDVARREVTATTSASAQLAHVEPGRAARSADAGLPVQAPVAAQASPAAKRAKPQSRRPASEPTRRTAPAAGAARIVSARPDAARVDAARIDAARGAAADSALAAARAAELAAGEHAAAGRRAAQDAVEAQARRQARSEAKRVAARKAEAAAARAAAARTAKAAAERTASAEAARKAKADAARTAKADAARKAKAAAARKAKAEAAEAARREHEAERTRAAAQAPSGPPTLRVVGGAAATPRRRAPKAAPAAARTAPARAAGQRASVPGWADVLLSTAPVRSADPAPRQD